MENELKEPIELFGYECGDGWLPLINEAKQLIDEWNEQHAVGDETDTWGGEKLEFVQVKEKWGELCIYCNFYPDSLYEKFRELEQKSLHVCEFCGTDKDVKTEKTHGWYMTLCPECRKAEIEKFNKRYEKTED